MTWRARKGFSPSWTKNSSSAGRSRPSKLSLESVPVMASAAAGTDVQFREEETDLLARGVGSVGAVHHVLVYGLGEIRSDGAGRSYLGIGGAHDVAVLEDGVCAFQHLDHHRPGDHEIHQRPEERPL